MKKVLWFSRHEMSQEQKEALGECEIINVDRKISHASELVEKINQCDVIAIVAPINLQKEFLDVANGKPVIMAVNAREFVKNDDGSETKTRFCFVKWERLIKIEVVKEDYIP